MGQFYDKIWDEDRAFLFLYYDKFYFNYDVDTEENLILPKVSQIRKKTKYLDVYEISDEQFKQKLMDLKYCNRDAAIIDGIRINEGIIMDINAKLDEIHTMFLEDKFLEFLIKQPMFDEKRIIVDYIGKLSRDPNSVGNHSIKYKFIEFLVERFRILADLFLQYKGKMIF